jgi:hypothetical protein
VGKAQAQELERKDLPWMTWLQKRRQMVLSICVNKQARIAYGRGLIQLELLNEFQNNIQDAETAAEVDRDIMTRKQVLQVNNTDQKTVAKQVEMCDVLPAINLLVHPTTRSLTPHARKTLAFWHNQKDPQFQQESIQERKLQGKKGLRPFGTPLLLSA